MPRPPGPRPPRLGRRLYQWHGHLGRRYEFQKWQDDHLARGLGQDVDFKQSALSTGPIFLYIFYGAYDALWQSYAYWLIGTESNSAARAAVLVGAYKSLQAAGGAMFWRVNAIKTSPTNQLAMDWGLCVGSLLVVLSMVWTVSTSTPAEAATGPDQAETEMMPPEGGQQPIAK